MSKCRYLHLSEPTFDERLRASIERGPGGVDIVHENRSVETIQTSSLLEGKGIFHVLSSLFTIEFGLTGRVAGSNKAIIGNRAYPCFLSKGLGDPKALVVGALI